MLRWPAREALQAYVHRMKLEAQTQYRIESLIYAIAVGYMGKKAKKPDVPLILRRK